MYLFNKEHLGSQMHNKNDCCITEEHSMDMHLARLQIGAGHRTFVRQIWGFDRETAQSDRTPWRASPVKMVISLKKANFNIWLWWITAKFYFDLCPLKAFVSLNWKHVTAINIHAVRTLEVACTVYWNWFRASSYEPGWPGWLGYRDEIGVCSYGDFQPAFRDEKFEKVVTRPFRREI